MKEEELLKQKYKVLEQNKVSRDSNKNSRLDKSNEKKNS